MQRNLNFEFLNSLTAEVATQPLFFAKLEGDAYEESALFNLS